MAVLLIQHKQEVMITPSDAEVVKPEDVLDVLIVAGSWDKLERLFTELQKTKTKQ